MILQYLIVFQIIFEGVYALHPEIRPSLDLWVAVVRYFSASLFISFHSYFFSYQEYLFLFLFTNQVGGVHSHLISRVQRDKSRVGCFMSQNEIMMTVFPMFQQHIEPHLVHAHVSTPETLDFSY